MTTNTSPLHLLDMACLRHVDITPSLYKDTPCVPVGDRQDILARLDNLPAFTARVESAIASARDADVTSLLLVTRIEKFRRILDCLGTKATEYVLADIAGFLRQAHGKPFTAARLAMDEFGVLLYNATPADGARLAQYIADKVNDALLPPTAGDISLGVSTGLAVINRHDPDADTVVRRARLNTGNGQRQGATENWSTVCSATLAADIRQALTNSRVAVHYQPVIGFDPDTPARYAVTCSVTGSNGETLPPGDVLTCANINNLGAVLDKQVLDAVLACNGDAVFQVPVSGNTLARPGLPDWLGSLLRDRHFPAERLQLLVSECDLQAHRGHVSTVCQALSAQGIVIVLADFGSRMDPLPTLAMITPGGVQLDTGMVRDLPYSRELQQQARQLINVLHQQHIRVGVAALDDITLLPLLFEIGVDHVQGDCLQAALPVPDYRFPEAIMLADPDSR